MKVPSLSGRRRGVAGILVAVLVFALIFTAGTGYLLYTTEANLLSYNAENQALAARLGADQESLAFNATIVGGNLDVRVNNTGGIPLSVVSAYLAYPSGMQSLCQVNTLNLGVGETSPSTALTGCSYSAGTVVNINLLTSRGNVFTTQYPGHTSVTVTTTNSVVSTTVTAPGGGGGNSLVVVMVATPIQVFSGNTITDNVTVFNYLSGQVTGVALQPSVPKSNVTGTVTITPQGCGTEPYTPPGQQPDPTASINGYSGTGVAPHIFFLCTYNANSGAVGGLVSFSGLAEATVVSSSTVEESASATSNLVQVGGLTNVLYQGAFSSNFFFFKYSSCKNAPNGGGGGYSYSSPGCTTNVAIPPANPNSLPEGTVMSDGSNYYVAYYVRVTNNFNTSLPILQYTYEQFEQSSGGESDWWIVGVNNTSFMNYGAYYPTYAPGSSPYLPTLTAYPTDCTTVNSKNIPTDKSCIYVDPGKTVILTLAACGPGLNYWDWGGTRYASSFDSGATGCASATPSFGSGGSATAGITVISFEYKGQILMEDIAFQGVAFTG